MASAKAARRYSSALLDLAKEQKKTDVVLRDLEFITNSIRHSKELSLFLKNKIISAEKKRAVLSELFEKQVSDLIFDFLMFLVSKKREDLLPDISKFLLEDYNKSAGIIDIYIYYAQELDESQIQDLKSVLENKTGKKVNLILKSDASLKGGVRVKIEDTVIDGSIKNKLKKLESLFMGSAV